MSLGLSASLRVVARGRPRAPRIPRVAAPATAPQPTEVMLHWHGAGGACCGGLHLNALSPRESEAFRHVAMGRTIRELAAAMGVRDKTAENYRGRLLAKLGLRNAAEAVHFAVAHGLLVPCARAAASAPRP